MLIDPIAGGIGCDGYVYEVTFLYVHAVQDGIESAFKLCKATYRLVKVITVDRPAGLLVSLGQRSAYQT